MIPDEHGIVADDMVRALEEVLRETLRWLVVVRKLGAGEQNVPRLLDAWHMLDFVSRVHQLGGNMAGHIEGALVGEGVQVKLGDLRAEVLRLDPSNTGEQLAALLELIREATCSDVWAEEA
jgi:hypothetical protein